MPNGPEHERTEAQATRSLAPISENDHEWRNRVLLGIAAIGLWIAHSLAHWPNSPPTGIGMLGVGLIAAASLALLVRAISNMVSAAQSRWLHVFCARRVLVCGVLVSALAVSFVVSIVRRDPFQAMASTGRITAAEVVDIGFVIAALVCVTGAAAAFLAALEAYRHERAWPLSMGRVGH